jgi:hypothetical protein
VQWIAWRRHVAPQAARVQNRLASPHLSSRPIVPQALAAPARASNQAALQVSRSFARGTVSFSDV